MSLSAYKILHLLGVMLLFCGFGGLCAVAMGAANDAARKALAMAHGLGLLLVLVGGFGLLAKLGMGAGLPLWIWLKIALWILLGAMIVLIRKAEKQAVILLFVLPLLGALGAYFAFFKLGT